MTIIHRDRLRSLQKNEKSKGGERFARGDVIHDALLPEFRLDETRIVFIAMRKLSPRSFKKNNAACKVSLLEFNKVRARAVSFNYSRIARESTKYI